MSPAQPAQKRLYHHAILTPSPSLPTGMPPAARHPNQVLYTLLYLYQSRSEFRPTVSSPPRVPFTIEAHMYLEFFALGLMQTRSLAQESIATFFVEHDFGAA